MKKIISIFSLLLGVAAGNAQTELMLKYGTNGVKANISIYQNGERVANYYSQDQVSLAGLQPGIYTYKTGTNHLGTIDTRLTGNTLELNCARLAVLVTDAQKAPLQNEMIEIYEDGELIQSMNTDANGGCSFYLKPSTKYAYKSRCGSGSVEIPEGKEGETVNLTLEGYQKIQLEAINELLSTKDFRIVLYCDFSDFCKNEKLIYNLDIITYLPNIKQLLVVNYEQPYQVIKSLDFLANTKLLTHFSILGYFAKTISLEAVSNLPNLRFLRLGDSVGLNKRQTDIINTLPKLEVLSVKELDASLLKYNANIRMLEIHSKLINGKVLPDKFPNIEYLYLKRQNKCSDFSYISRFIYLKALILHWIYDIQALPNLTILKDLEALDLYGCPNLQYGIEQIFELNNLVCFRATELQRLTTESFKRLLQLPKIQSVHIHFRKNNVENEKMDRMLQKCNLKKGFNYRYLTRKDNP